MKAKPYLVIAIVFIMCTIIGCEKNDAVNENQLTPESTGSAEIKADKKVQQENATMEPENKVQKELEYKYLEATAEIMKASGDDYAELDGDITPSEEELGIDKETRKKMIDLMGKDTYWYGVNSAVIVLHTQEATKNPIYKTKMDNLKEKYTIEEVTLESDYDGHKIPADYILADGEKNNDTIIFVHGAGGNRQSDQNLFGDFLQRGVNVLTYDQCGAGDNTGKFCTYGQYEQYDLMQYISYVRANMDDNRKLYIYASSMGAATAGRVLGSNLGNQNIDGAILDCPLGSERDIIEANFLLYTDIDTARFHIKCAEEVMTYLYGYNLDDAEIERYMAKTTVPVLVMTSKGDGTIPCEIPTALYEAILHNRKYLYVSQTSPHCAIQETDKEQYYELVDQFLNGDLFKE